MSESLIFNDPYLHPYAGTISRRREAAKTLERKIREENRGDLAAFADYHDTFGFFRENGGWVVREWAPNAEAIFILCQASGWEKDEAFRLTRKKDGIFEGRFSGEIFVHGDLYRFKVVWPGGEGDRIPTAAKRVVQDPVTLIFNAQVWFPVPGYAWRTPNFAPSDKPLLIYETHVGMALEEGRVGTYHEFEQYILPKIVAAGYTAIQLMAIQEHPYYGSFGYHVSSFFAPSSRFGTPEELKHLIDTAHGLGIRVLMDIIHSHAVNNEVEGISRFDGTRYQFFHDGPKGYHRLWDSRCFDYAKPMVIKFLLSNIRYWIETFKVDGFRFDGITSMIFEDHGLGRAFVSYADYFGEDVDQDALSYLDLANCLAHELNPSFITIAEDVSGYPGLAASRSAGGIGFDFRYAMGIADHWIKLLKDLKDEEWHLGTLWYELTTRRREEKTISYAESHDQALVGDKTLMMHLMGGHIYSAMKKDNQSIETVRGVALHKMIRLITIASAGSGYLNFMGNEFGHPEWVDFPSERNQFSFHYARRQWSLKYDSELYFSALAEFDRQMISLVRDHDLYSFSDVRLTFLHEDDRVLAFERGSLFFIYNFNAMISFTDYRMDVTPGRYELVLNTDDANFGGMGRLKNEPDHFTQVHSSESGARNLLSLYLPTRTALVFKRADSANPM